MGALMGEWQPIETAPKNPAGEFVGPVILVFCNADGYPWPAHWAEGRQGDGVWMVVDDGRPCGEIWPQNATHWMPLPEPPRD